MNTRELFEKVKAHLLAQGCRATDAGSCMYRARNGTKCAVGCLIDDRHYYPGLEGQPFEKVYTSIVRRAVAGSIGRKLTHNEIYMLWDLQIVHDTYPPSTWPEHLDKVEQEYFGEGDE